VLSVVSSGGRHTSSKRDWSSDACSPDLGYGDAEIRATLAAGAKLLHPASLVQPAGERPAGLAHHGHLQLGGADAHPLIDLQRRQVQPDGGEILAERARGECAVSSTFAVRE